MSLDELEQLLETPRESPSEKRPIVVVIDDDMSIRSSLTTVLKDKYLVRVCSSAIEGVRAVDQQVCCVILDVKMPTHDGFWVCKHLRKRVPDVPVIFHSGYQDVKDPDEVMSEFRPFGYVVKGNSLATLLSLVASAVRHTERLKANRTTVDQLRRAREQLLQVPGHAGAQRASEPPGKQQK
jgi:DNA-binding NtrC family response regulator